MGKIKEVCTNSYEANIQALVKQANQYIESYGEVNRAEGRGMLRVINVLELLRANDVPEGQCPAIGDKLHTIGELRSLMQELKDSDTICIETIDLKTGDVEDQYPMYMDVINGIKLDSGKVVNKIKFCQMPDAQSDTNDYRITLNFTKVYNQLVKTNKKTHITHAIGYSTTTQLNNVLDGSSCISTPVIMELVKKYNVNPTFIFTGTGKMFNE